MNERSIFLAVLEIDDPGQRSAYLDQACAGDPALRGQVEQLLQAHQQPGQFMERPAPALLATIDEPPITERPGTVIGPYKLLEQIGEGGFGVVFMAEQQAPIRRKVALKVLKPGMDTRQVIARFEAERQALALMDHPNIAQVHDGGETASGRPYFVMELVHGIPITVYCDQEQLTPRQRLELFIPVCQAVQHAHQKGIIHRDIKPTNVLVTLHDGVPMVKVIDFGIAKAMGHRLTDKTLFTNFAQMIGTPLYMAPEQAGLGTPDVDTRSDIYSLGVLLYELLTGTTPFDKQRFKETSYDEIRRIIREEEPPKPSTRMSTLGQAATTVSTQRKSDPRRLSQLFRGELDWIVMKCLEKDRNRRYESASALAADVQRYLHDEPVHACPPSALYRFRKFARRNKTVLAITGCVLTALAIGLGLATWQWRLAEARHAEAKQAGEKARRAEAVTTAINRFLIKDMLSAAKPEQALGRKVTVEEVLNNAERTIDTAFPNETEEEAAVRLALGSAYRSLALYDKAELHVQRALDIRQQLLGADAPDTFEATKELGQVWIGQGRSVQAEQLFRATLDQARLALGNEHRLTLQLQNSVATAVWEQGRFADALALYRQCLQAETQSLGEEDLDTVETMDSLASLLGEWLRDWQEAERLCRRCLEIRRRVLTEKHPDTLGTQMNLAQILLVNGEWKEAERVSREAFNLALGVLGPTHDETLRIEKELAMNLGNLDQLEEAEKLFREVVERRPIVDQPETVSARIILSRVLVERGKLDEAERVLGEVLAATRNESVWHYPFARCWLGMALQERGKWAEAEEHLRRALEGYRRAKGAGHHLTPRGASFLAILLDATGQHEEAGALFREALETWHNNALQNHPFRAITLSAWGEHLLMVGDLHQAEPALVEALRIERAALPPEHRALGETLSALGWLRTQTGQVPEGEKLLHEALKVCHQAWPVYMWRPEHWRPADAESRLGGCLTALSRFDEAEKLLLRSYETLHKLPGTPPVRRTEAADRIIKLYETWGKPEKAAEWRAKRPALPKRDAKGAEPPKDK